MESHAGQVFTCVAALSIAGALHVVDADLLSWWCASATQPLLYTAPCPPPSCPVVPICVFGATPVCVWMLSGTHMCARARLLPCCMCHAFVCTCAFAYWLSGAGARVLGLKGGT